MDNLRVMRRDHEGDFCRVADEDLLMTEIFAVCTVNRYNWPVRIDIDRFNSIFDLTDNLLHGIISGECIAQHCLGVDSRADIIVQGFDAIREDITVKRVTAALTA